jgi:hypothetical protein
MIDKRSNITEWDLVPHQQEGFVGLMSTALNAYMNLLCIPFSFCQIPFSFYQMAVNGTEAATEQVKHLAGQATLQATEAATEQVRQLTEYATLQATEAATQQVRQLAKQATQQATEAATQQVRQLAEQATRQATEAAIQQVRQLAKQATQQAIEAATQQVKQLAEQAATQQAKHLAEQAALQVAEAAGTAARLQREQAQVWTFEHPLQQADSHRPILLRVHAPGIAHAGINREGKWIRTYDVPLEEVSPDVWEAYLLDPEINELTFIWYDPDQPGKVQWEGKNYPLPRQQKSA